MSVKSKQIFFLSLVLAYCLYAAIDLSVSGGKQWDFKTYYYAAEVHERGGDPYDMRAINQVSPELIDLNYVYPPLTVYFFRAFSVFNWDIAAQLWLWIKILIAVALVVIWRRFFFAGGSLALFILFSLLAFSSSIYFDLLAGNVSLIEQLFLWLGFVFFLKKRGVPFVIFIVLASFFKFTYLGFLILIFGLPRQDRLVAALAGVGLACVYVVSSYLNDPAQFGRFIEVAAAIKEGGAKYNHSLLAFIQDSADLAVEKATTTTIPVWVVYGTYIASALAILWISIREWIGYVRRSGFDAKLFLFLVCIVFTLVAPRMKTYSYILLVLPAFFILLQCVRNYTLVFGFILLSLTKWTPLPTVPAVKLLWWHYPWLLAFMLWIILLRYLRRPPEGESTNSASAGFLPSSA